MPSVSRSFVSVILVIGVLLALVSFSMLVTATSQKKWIKYEYTTTSGFVTTVVDVDIGLWRVEGSAASTAFGNTVITDINGDSTDYDYFDKNLIKCCRVFSILGSLLLLISAVFASLTQFFQKTIKPFFIISVSSSGVTVLLLAVALTLVKRELKDGMSVSLSYSLGIGVNVLAAITTIVFTLVFILNIKGLVKSTSVVQQSTIEDQIKN